VTAKLYALATSIFLAAAGSSPAADFYAGKTLTLMVNFAPGGPTDVEARFLARHLGGFIAGNPTIVVQNRGGGGGAVGTNWLGEVAPKDGLTLGYLAGVAARAAVDDPAMRVDMTKLTFISAGPPGPQLTFMRTDFGPGLKKPEDIMKARDLWAAGISVDSNKDIRMRMQLEMLGLPFRFVTGYPGTADIRLAIQRGEAHLATESIPSYRQAIEPTMTKSGVVMPLWSDPIDDGSVLRRAPDSDRLGVPAFHEFYKQVKGSEPSGELWEAFRMLTHVGTVFLRVLAMPPDTPPEAAAALRRAIDAFQNDPRIRNEAETTFMYTPSYPNGEAVELQFKRMLKQSPEMKAFVQKYVESGSTKR
jgi:hypothetical protein